MSTLPLQEDIERFHRASDFFGDPVKRWNDRLSLERHLQVENYCRGRMAFLLDCEFLPPRIRERANFPVQSKTAGGFRYPESVSEVQRAILVLKVNTVESHKLQKWDKQLVFVPDIQPVQGPQGKIPSLVGLYRIDDKVPHRESDLLLFQSALHGIHKFFPGTEYWESCPISWLPVALQHDLVPEKIQSASEIVQSVPDNESKHTGREGKLIKLDSHVNKFPVVIAVDVDGVEIIRSGPLNQGGFNIRDVFFGPLNL